MVKKFLDKLFGAKKEDYIDTQHEHIVMEKHFSALKIYNKNCENLSIMDRYKFKEKIKEFKTDYRLYIHSEENLEICRGFESKCDVKLNKSLEKKYPLLINLFIIEDLDMRMYIDIQVKTMLASDGYTFDDELKFIKEEIDRVECLLDPVSISNEGNMLKRRYINDLRKIRVSLHKALNKN